MGWFCCLLRIGVFALEYTSSRFIQLYVLRYTMNGSHIPPVSGSVRIFYTRSYYVFIASFVNEIVLQVSKGSLERFACLEDRLEPDLNRLMFRRFPFRVFCLPTRRDSTLFTFHNLEPLPTSHPLTLLTFCHHSDHYLLHTYSSII